MRFGQYMPGIRAKTSVRGKEFSVPVIWLAFPLSSANSRNADSKDIGHATMIRYGCSLPKKAFSRPV
jgi:hypothetical protein